jgi:hypothetical protein
MTPKTLLPCVVCAVLAVARHEELGIGGTSLTGRYEIAEVNLVGVDQLDDSLVRRVMRR